MKIILHTNGNIIDTITGVDNVSFNDNNIYWNNGSLTGINTDFIVLNDEEDLTDDRILEDKRQKKLNELDTACNNAIIGKFPFDKDGMTYYFSSSLEAQGNFDKAARAFDKGMITEIPWTCYLVDETVTRITFDSITFESLYSTHLSHIQNNISKFRDTLMPQVMSATTIEQIELIKW